uniref:protein-serine/threonine phosphatase n=1 Tax=Toxoplasma gondii COUG TaxID=1074873 RepID=A0A2G8Y6Q1_TOXGO|nr:NLI interacting factor family phosphatase [Toxoplasma gondii COUG]
METDGVSGGASRLLGEVERSDKKRFRSVEEMKAEKKPALLPSIRTETSSATYMVQSSRPPRQNSFASSASAVAASSSSAFSPRVHALVPDKKPSSNALEACREQEKLERVFLPRRTALSLPLTLKWMVQPGAFVVAGQTLALLYPQHPSPSPSSPSPSSPSPSSPSPSSPSPFPRSSSPSASDSLRESAEAGAERVAEDGLVVSDENGEKSSKGLRDSQGKGNDDALRCFDLPAPVAGRVASLAIPGGSEIRDAELCVCEIAPAACAHALVVGGLCAICGVEVRETHLQEKTVHAGFVSTHKDLRLDREFARRMEYERMSTLLTKRKLCLILDLDNTLLQASPDLPPLDGPPLILLDDFCACRPPSAKSASSAKPERSISSAGVAAQSKMPTVGDIADKTRERQRDGEEDMRDATTNGETEDVGDRDAGERVYGEAQREHKSATEEPEGEEGVTSLALTDVPSVSSSLSSSLFSSVVAAAEPAEAAGEREKREGEGETRDPEREAKDARTADGRDASMKKRGELRVQQEGESRGNRGEGRGEQRGERGEERRERRRGGREGRRPEREGKESSVHGETQASRGTPWALRRGFWTPTAEEFSRWVDVCFPTRAEGNEQCVSSAGEGKTKEASVGEDRERSEEAKSSEERGDRGLGASRDEEAKPVERGAREALQTVGDVDAERDVDGKEADRTKQDRRGKEEETEYPHYREDAEGEAIRHTLEKSVIGVRVAVEASPVGASRRAREGWRRAASRHEAGALPLPSEQHITFFKLRPGCLDFLRRVSQTFELYMYTMGTALHAATALRILDPKRRFFGRRVFSRQDAVNGLKAIERIFPHDQKMVIVVDDLECMWSYSPCCIKVTTNAYMHTYKFSQLSLSADTYIEMHA